MTQDDGDGPGVRPGVGSDMNEMDELGPDLDAVLGKALRRASAFRQSKPSRQ